MGTATADAVWQEWVDAHRSSEPAKSITREQYESAIAHIGGRASGIKAVFPVRRDRFALSQRVIAAGFLPVSPYGADCPMPYDRVTFTRSNGVWKLEPPTVIEEEPE